MIRTRRGSSASTASRGAGAAGTGSRRAGLPTITCSHPTCSATARRRYEPPWSIAEHVDAARRDASGRSRRPGSATRSAAGSRSRSPPGVPPRRAARAPRPCDPARPRDRAARGRAGPRRPVVRVVRGGRRAALRGERAPAHAERARGRGSRGLPRRRPRRPLALPLQPGRRGRAVRGDGVARRRRSRPSASRRCSCSARTRTSRYDHLLDDHRAALGDLLQVVTVPGGHTVLWDALEETATAIAAFLRPERMPPLRRAKRAHAFESRGASASDRAIVSPVRACLTGGRPADRSRDRRAAYGIRRTLRYAHLDRRTRRRSRGRRRGSRRPPRPPRASRSAAARP